jgi:RNA polymerase sigma factor (sigma-70 family)
MPAGAEGREARGEARGAVDQTPTDALLAQLYEEHRRWLYARCLGMLGDAAAAEDAVHETFVQARRYLPTLTGDQRAYLAVTARNLCRRELLRRRRATCDGELTGSAFGSGDVDDAAVRRVLLTTVWRRLRPPDRDVLTRAASGLSVTDIAAQLGISADAAAQRLSRARRRAQEVLTALRGAVPGAALGHRLLRRIATRINHAAGSSLRLLTPLVEGATGLVLPLAIAAAALPAAVTTPPSQLLAATAPTATLRADPNAVVTAPTSTAPAAVRSAPSAPGRATSATPPPSAYDPVLNTGLAGPTAATTPEDTHVLSFTASPSYAQDRTVFASGLVSACAARCAVLFRSRDGGSSWSVLPSVGFNGGQILLPPSFPDDPLLLAADGYGSLQRSDDGGATFRPILAAQTGDVPVVVDPGSLAGNTGVFFVENTASLLEYHAASGTVTVVASLPPDVGGVGQILAPRGSPDVFLFGTHTFGGLVLLDCRPRDGSCNSIPVPQGATHLTPSLTFTTDDTLFAAAGSAVVAFTAGPTMISTQMTLPAVPFDTAVLDATGPPSTATVSVAALMPSANNAQTAGIWDGTTGQPMRLRTDHIDWHSMGIPSAVQLPDGRLLIGVAAPDGSALQGLGCSSDGGRTWRSRC